jgi:peptide/nickel transport system substrate-binding protein
MKIRLRAGVKFHDGSPASAPTIVKALVRLLPQYLGPAFDDVDHITSLDDGQIEIGFRRPSPLLLEALEAPIPKPGSTDIGTGPYAAVGSDVPKQMQSNKNYYLGKPAISQIVVDTFPNVRSAWAELLRDHIDMLYEVGLDALDSLASASNVSVFTYVRHYQYVLIFNTNAGPLRSREVRRALNEAIDSNALIRDAFDGHAMASSGPIWPQHWAFRSDFPRFSYDPKAAAEALTAMERRSEKRTPSVRFRCLVRPPLERIALVVKNQLEAVGAEMSVQEAPLESIMQAVAKRDFDAVLLETISGPNLLRPYRVWHSGVLNPGGLGNHQFDLALDRIRYATNDDEYGSAVADFQKATVDDPPAIFLAWPERARAVSKRFQVPAEQGRDVLPTLRMWRPVNAEKAASRN